MTTRRSRDATSRATLETLYARPGFMLRRAHQIAVSLFLEETAALGITTTQYGMLYLLRAKPGIDQAALARAIGLDRSTTGFVVGRLEASGYVARIAHATDARRKTLALTPAGAAVLRRLAGPAGRASERLLSPLAHGERARFLALLARIVDTHNRIVRSPLERD